MKKRQNQLGKMMSGIKRMFPVILGLTMILIVMGGFQMSADASGRDIYDKVNYNIDSLQAKKYGTSEFVDVIKDGKVVSPLPTIYKNDSARIAFKFSINQPVEVNDYFKITIPEGIMKLNRSVTKPLLNGSEQIGTIELNPQDSTQGYKSTLKVTFSVAGQSVHDGFLAAGGTFHEIKSDVEFPLNKDGSLRSTISVINRPKTDENHFSPGLSPKQPWQPTMNKVGSYNYDDNWFVYALVINGDERSKLYKQNITGRDQVKTRKNIYVFDELPEGMTFNTDRRTKDGKKIEAFRFLMNYDVPAYENDVIMEDTMSNTLGTSVTLPFEIPDDGGSSTILVPKTGATLFTFDKTHQNLTWEKFQEYIRSKNDRRIGIWKNTKMIINVGTLPMTDVKYEDFYANGADGFKAALQKSLDEKKISQEQKDRMERAYIGQDVISFLFDYRTFVNGEMEDVYVNNAYFNYNENKVFPKKATVKFDWVKGSARLVPFSGSIKVKKEWKGTVGSDVSITLTASNDTSINQPATLSAGNSEAWTHTFTGLKEKKTGTEERILYTVKETPQSGYRSVIKRTKEGFLITNIEQMNFTVQKKWLDHSGGTIAPNLPIEIALYKEGSSIPLKTETLAAGGTSIIFTDLDKYDLEGNPIKYHAKEVATPYGYDVSYSAPTTDSNNFVITNKKKDPSLAKRTIEVTKIWKDNTGRIVNKTATGLPEVKIYLTENGTKNEAKFLTLNAGNKWADKFTELPIFDSNGKEIKYSVEEDAVANYEAPTYDGTMEDGFTVTNKLKSKEVKVTKIWKDIDDTTFNDPSLPEIEVEVKESGTKKTVVSKILSFFTDGWEYIFKGLPADKTYVVGEKTVSGYDSKVEPVTTGNDSAFILTNKRNQRNSIQITKKWVQADGKTELTTEEKTSLPDKVIINLYKADSTDVFKKLTLKKSEDWMGSFTGLPKYKPDGKTAMVYAVTEEPVNGYTPKTPRVEILGGIDSVEIINIKNDPSLKNIAVTKEWQTNAGVKITDSTFLAGLKATFELHKKVEPATDFEKVTSVPPIEITGNHSASFVSLPKTEGGKVIEYKVVETGSAPKFTKDSNPTVDGDGNYHFINKMEPIPKKNLKVHKVWKKQDGSLFLDGEKASLPNVEVKLYKKTDLDTVIQSKELNKGNNWSIDFENLDQYEQNGITPIIYVIKESPVEGFTAEISEIEVAEAMTDVTFTNKKNTPPSGGIYIPPTDETKTEEPKKPEEPKTDDSDKPELSKPEPPSSVEEIPGTPPTPPVLIPDIPVFVTEEEEPNVPLPNHPITEIEEDEIPLAPPVPPSIPIIIDEIPELVLDEDGVPLGNTEVEAEKKIKKDTKPKKVKTKKLLAQSGGLMNHFLPTAMALGFLILLYVALSKYFKKKD